MSKEGSRDCPVTTQNRSPELPSALCNGPLQCCDTLSGRANLLGWGGDRNMDATVIYVINSLVLEN